MRFILFYHDDNGVQKSLVVNDTTHSRLPVGADDVVREHGEDYNDAGGIVIIPLADGDETPDAMDAYGDEIPRTFVDL